MQRRWVLVGWLGVFAVFGALIAGAARPATAAATATLEIHKRICHNGAPKVDIFKECHQFPPEQEVRFKVDNGASRAVNAEGNVIFAGLAAGPGPSTGIAWWRRHDNPDHQWQAATA